jgi:hypoxanthine-guanine phosphoribosyltransferase
MQYRPTNQAPTSTRSAHEVDRGLQVHWHVVHCVMSISFTFISELCRQCATLQYMKVSRHIQVYFTARIVSRY